MLMRPEKPKPFLTRALDAFLAKINSSRFAAAQRRRALRGLDARQLADIGLIYVNGDYRPHPDAVPWRPEAGIQESDDTLNPLVPAKAGTQSQN